MLRRLSSQVCIAGLASCLLVAPAMAGPGDPSAAFIATNAAPGETTSTRCNSNGFVEVIFSLGGAVVSTVESGDTCTPGTSTTSVGTSSTGGESEAQRENQNDLDDLEDLHGRVWDDEGDELDVGGGEDEDSGEDGGGGEDGEGGNDDADNGAELRRLEGELAEEKAKNAEMTAEFFSNARLIEEMKAAREEFSAANEKKIQAISETLEEARVELQRWENIYTALRALNEARDLFTATPASSPEMPSIERRLEETRADLRALGVPERTSIASVEASRREALSAFNSAESAHLAAIDDASEESKDLGVQIRVAEEGQKLIATDIARSDARITSLESRIRNLKRQNQLSGPAPQPSILDLINARGVHTWVSGDVTWAEDTRSGQRRDTEAWRVTAGAQLRLTERVTTGMSFTYGFSDTDDKTGIGTSKEADTYLVSPFVAYRLSPDTGLRAGVVYSQTETDAVRAGGATASYTTRGYGARVGASTREKLNPWVTVRGGLSQSFFYSETDGYTDSVGRVTPNADSRSSTTHVSTRMDVAATPDLSLYGSLNGSYALLKSDGDRDRADAYLGVGADYDAGIALLSAEVGKTVLRNNYDDITARVTAQVTF
ncbi:MAG: autotransporter domain-containing protein [Pseudomonadota bacterium]